MDDSPSVLPPYNTDGAQETRPSRPKLAELIVPSMTPANLEKAIKEHKVDVLEEGTVFRTLS
jgi:hypothetical protein